MSESKGSKRGRFDEDTVKLLSDFVKQQPGCKLNLSDIGEFYQAYPQLNGIFAGRLTKVVSSFPSLLTIEKDSENKTQLLVAPEHNQPPGGKQEVMSKIQSKSEEKPQELNEAVHALVAYLQHQCEDGTLLSSSLHKFYSYYPEFNKVFDGKFKMLSRKYGGLISIHTVKGQAAFRLSSQTPKATPRDEVHLSSEFGTIELLNAEEFDEVVRNALANASSDNTWIIDADIDEPELMTLILLSSKDRTIVTRVDASSGSTKLESLQVLLQHKTITKVCFDSETLQCLFSRVVGARLTRVFDLETSMHMLSPEAPKILTLNDLMREYEIQSQFNQDSLRQNFSQDRRQYLSAFARYSYYTRMIYERIWEDAYSRNKIESCFTASDRKVIRGINLTIRDLDVELIRLRKVAFSDDLSQTSKLAPGLQSFKTKLAQAKRRVGFTRQRLPPNACYHYHVLTPGYCERAERCKYLHGIASEDVD